MITLSDGYDFAKLIGDAHETENYSTTTDPHALMDFHNNHAGRQIGQSLIGTNWTIASVKQAIFLARQQGKLREWACRPNVFPATNPSTKKIYCPE